VLKEDSAVCVCCRYADGRTDGYRGVSYGAAFHGLPSNGDTVCALTAFANQPAGTRHRTPVILYLSPTGR
jgi:hypothetical protein